MPSHDRPRRLVRLDGIRRVDADVHDEIAFHLESRTNDLVATGLTPAAARERAEAEFGDLARGHAELAQLDRRALRRRRGSDWLSSWWYDIRHAVRRLARTPSFSVATLATMSFGIGAATAIYGLAWAIWFKPLPYAHPDRLLVVGSTFNGAWSNSISAPDLADLQRRTDVFAEVGGFGYGAAFDRVGDRLTRITAYRVTPELFPMLGVRPALGRTFLSSDADQENGPVVILSHEYWRTRHGADSGVVGRGIRLHDATFTVVGVMPPTFRFPEASPSDVWTPMSLTRGSPDRAARYLQGIARTRPDVTPAQLGNGLRTLAANLAAAHPGSNQDWGFATRSFVDETLGRYGTVFTLLLAAVGLLLLIASVNIAGLFLARNVVRSQDFVIRRALGATRSRLRRQVVAECLVLGVVGGVLGLFVADGLCAGLAAMFPADTPRVADIGVDAHVVAAGLLISLGTALLCGLIPPVPGRAATNTSLTPDRRTAGGRAMSRLHGGLIVAEIALAMVLLAGAGLMVRSFRALTSRDFGFSQTNLLTLHLTVPSLRYQDPVARADLFARAVDAIRKVPGVMSAGTVTGYPASRQGVLAVGSVAPQGGSAPPQVASFRAISPEYFPTMNVRLLEGRGFTSNDAYGTEPVAIVNQAVADQLWPGESPVDRVFLLPPPLADPGARTPVRVVGVAANIRLGATAPLQVFLPTQQASIFWNDVVIRTATDPRKAGPSIEQALRSIEPDFLIEEVVPMDRILSNLVSLPRIQSVVITSFATFAFLLSILGVSGLMSLAVSQRSREIGIRKAMGASAFDVVRTVAGRGLSLAVLGTCLGAVASVAVVRLVRGQVFGLQSLHVGVLAATGGLLILAVLLTCLGHSRRALRVEAVMTLR